MGNGTSIGKVRGLGSAKHGPHHWLLQRFTAAGTFLCAVAAAGGDVLLSGGRADHLEAVIEKLRAANNPVAHKKFSASLDAQCVAFLI